MKGLGEVLGSCNDFVSRCRRRHQNFVRKPGEGVHLADRSGFPNPGAEGPVAIQLRAHIPSIFAMGIPGASPVWFLMDNHMGARRGNGIAVEVKGTKDLGPSRELGVDSTSTEEVQGEITLWDELAPKMEGEFVGCGAEACNKMVLVGLDAPFSSIGSVHASRGSLVFDSFFIHIFFQYS